MKYNTWDQCKNDTIHLRKTTLGPCHENLDNNDLQTDGLCAGGEGVCQN